MIEIIVNGKGWEVGPNTTISHLLGKIKISPNICVVEKNGQIVTRDLLTKTVLNNNDTLEIIRIMGGG